MLKLTKDRKVTNHVTPSGNPSIANSFGLPAGAEYSCPFATNYCSKVCYAGKLEKLFPGTRTNLLHNFAILKALSRQEQTEVLSNMIKAFETQCEKRNAPKLFRIHWDGDFFSEDYVSAWANVILLHPNVQFWVYTRVPYAAEYLHSLKFHNLGLYFSGDRDNLAIARSLSAKGINIAYVDTTFAEGKEKFSKATKCPENNKALPLIDSNGSACAKCGLCIYGRKDVLFSTTKR